MIHAESIYGDLEVITISDQPPCEPPLWAIT